MAELSVGETIIQAMEEMTLLNAGGMGRLENINDDCVRSVRCPGGCKDSCVPLMELETYGSSVQRDLDSTLDECILNVHCLGRCEGECVSINQQTGGTGRTGGHIVTGTVSAVQAISGWKSSQDCEGGRDPRSLATLDGNSLQKPRGNAQFNIQEYEHFPETHCTQELCPAIQVGDCTPVFKRIHSVLDWRGVGGVVQKQEGLSTTDTTLVKYCPGGDMPKYQYAGYKPNCSRRQFVAPPISCLEKISDICKISSVDNTNFPVLNINKLIAEWESKENIQPEQSKQKEGERGVQRRKSEHFIHLTNMFESQRREGNVIVKGEGEVPANLLSKHKPTSFYSIFGEGGKIRNGKQSRKVRVVRRDGCVREGGRGLPLAASNTNGKRARDSEHNNESNYLCLPGISNTKKFKSFAWGQPN